MFLPLVLLGLAAKHACPTSYLPAQEDVANAAWDGVLNATTSCVLRVTKDVNPFNVFGNPNYAENKWPKHMITEHEGSLDPFFVKDYKFEDLSKDNFECDFTGSDGMGNLDFEVVRNVTVYGYECKEKTCLKMPRGSHSPGVMRQSTMSVNMTGVLMEGAPCDCFREAPYNEWRPAVLDKDNGDGTYNCIFPDGAKQIGAHPYQIRVSGLPENGAWNPNPLAHTWTFDMTSTNEHVLPSGMSETEVDPDDAESVDSYFFVKPVFYDESTTFRFDISFMTRKWAIGATTATVKLSDTYEYEGVTYTRNGEFSFTISPVPFKECPFRVKFFGGKVRAMTFSSLVISLSVVGQALLYFTVSAFGDFGPWRKLILCYFSLIGSGSCMLIILCQDPDKYMLAGALAMTSNIFFGGSCVLYNAFLPYLSRSHPRFLTAKFEYKNIKTGAATGVGAASKKLLDSYHDVQDEISATGFFYGYVSGSLCCFVSIGIVLAFNSLFGILLSIFLMGVWWFVFALPLFFFLKTRPGPPFPDDSKVSVFHAISFSWRRILSGLAALRFIPHTRRFLIGFWCFSDGYNTIASMAILFAQTELGMGMTGLIVLGAEAPLFGALGMKLFRYIQIKRKLESQQMLLYGLYMLLALCCYALLGIIRDQHVWDGMTFGVVQKNEMFIVVIVYGLLLGPVQSYSRTFFTDLIPPGQEAEYFGLYEVTDKGSSWIGPLMCGAIYESTGSLRLGFVYLIFTIAVGIYLTYTTDAIRGSDDCRRKEVLVRIAALRLKWGISKSQAPPSAKKMIGLKTTQASGKSATSGAASTAPSRASTGSMVGSQVSGIGKSGVDDDDGMNAQTVVEGEGGEQSFKMFNNKVAPMGGDDDVFGGKTVIEGEDDQDPFGGKTVVEGDDDGDAFGGKTVVEKDDEEDAFGGKTVIEKDD